nr:MAG TPA: hypothetical protein [Caudoviricetes sp.]
MGIHTTLCRLDERTTHLSNLFMNKLSPLLLAWAFLTGLSLTSHH